MIYLCSRRKLSADGRRFTARPGSQTSFLRTGMPQRSATPGHRIDPRIWAREVLAQSANGSVLIVIHGFRTPQNTFLKEVANVRQRLGSRYPGAVIGLDWPTNGRLFDYRDDRRDAAATAPFLLRDCVETLVAARPGVKLHMLTHSMGCFFTSEALRAALGTSLERKLRGAMRTISVTAADVDQDWSQAHHPFTQAVNRTCRAFVSHSSGNDEVLHISEDRYHGRRKRLGRDGMIGPNLAIQKTVDWTAHYASVYRNPFGIQQSHSFYYRDARFYDFLVDTLRTAA